MTTRTFEFTEGTSNKFWTIALDGGEHTSSSARIGSPIRCSNARVNAPAQRS